MNEEGDMAFVETIGIIADDIIYCGTGTSWPQYYEIEVGSEKWVLQQNWLGICEYVNGTWNGGTSEPPCGDPWSCMTEYAPDISCGVGTCPGGKCPEGCDGYVEIPFYHYYIWSCP